MWQKTESGNKGIEDYLPCNYPVMNISAVDETTLEDIYIFCQKYSASDLHSEMEPQLSWQNEMIYYFFQISG